MRLTSFHVQGFKSLVDVKLDDLQDINVFHGPNNVGKSNLLAAMDLFFELIRQEGPRTKDIMYRWAVDPRHGRFLNVFAPGVVELDGTVSVSRDGGQASGVAVRFGVEATASGPIASLRDFEPEAAATSSLGVDDFAVVAEGDTALSLATPGGELRSTYYSLVDARRRTQASGQLTGGQDITPQSLRDRLFDIESDTDAAVSDRWRLFREAFLALPPPLGPIAFRMTFDRQKGKRGEANLACDMNGSSVLLDDLGTGVQQLVALMGHLLTTDAKIVAIEEPELNLSYPLQKVLRGMLERVVADEAGPDQLFITSHSPAFDGHGEFFRVWMEEHETKVERAPVRQRWAQTGWPTDTDLEDAARPPVGALGGYVTSDGLVELPTDVTQAMGLQHGDHVFFAKDDDGYWKLVGPKEWESLMEGLEDE